MDELKGVDIGNKLKVKNKKMICCATNIIILTLSWKKSREVDLLTVRCILITEVMLLRRERLQFSGSSARLWDRVCHPV